MPERRRLDVVLDEAFLADLDLLPLDELRERRQLAHEVENELSYYRRLLHARMDLVAFEQRRRRGEDTRTLVEALPTILADSVVAPARTDATRVRPLVADVPPLPEVGRRDIDRLLGDDLLLHLEDLPDDELRRSLDMLADSEAEISRLRRRVQVVEDTLAATVASRYRSGFPGSVGS